MKTTERLLKATEEIWAAYSRHPFVRGIRDGTLDRGKFRYYIVQDSLYLRDYAKTFALGVAKAGSLQTAEMFARYIGAMHGEMDVHQGYLAALGVTQEAMDAARPSLSSLSYTSYLLRVAYEGGEAEILAAILSCAYSYEVIAKTIVRENPAAAEHPFFGAWVRGYASAEYAAENRTLLDALDRLTAEAPERQLRKLEEIFVASSRYELAFWEMAWNRSD